MILSQLVLAILAMNTTGSKKLGPELFVRTTPTISVERLAEVVRPMGTIESRTPGTHVYLIQLNPGVDQDKAEEKLEKLPGLHVLTADEEPVDMQSVKSLRRKLAHLEVDDADEAQQGGGKKAHKRDAGADYLESYKYLLESRAFPNDSFDWSTVYRARQHANKMPVGHVSGGRPGQPEAIEQMWEFAGPTNLKAADTICFGLGTNTGRINALAFDPLNSNFIYAGTAGGGLWRSIDAGLTWTWMSSTWSQLDVNCIAIDPVDPFIVYVGMGDYVGGRTGSYGLMKSTDGGLTWSEVITATAGNIGVTSILIDPTNHNTIIAGVGDGNTYGNLLISNDGGKTWAYSYYFGQYQDLSAYFPNIVASAPNGNAVTFYTVLAGNWPDSAGYGRIVCSQDHGKTWLFVPSPLSDANQEADAISLVASPTNPKALYVLDSTNTKLYSTQDGGVTWNDLSANLPLGGTLFKKNNYNFSQAGYDYYIACGNRITNNQTKDVLYLGEIDIQESTDLGQSWQSIGGPTWLTPEQGAITHNDQHCFAICPSNPNLFLFGNDGGAYRMTYSNATGKNTVTAINGGGISATMFYKIACHPTDPNYLLGGTQDNGTPLSPSSILNWVNPGDGDGGGCAINQSNTQISYLSSEGLNIWRTGDGWSSVGGISPPIAKNERAPFVCTMVLDPNNQYTMYTGSNLLWQYDDTTNSWTGGGTDLTNGNGSISAIAVAPTDSKTIYTGSADGALNVSPDTGQSWRNLFQVVKLSINAISVNPSRSDDFLIGYGGSGKPHLYKARVTSGSISYTNVSGSGAASLPDASLNAIARDIDDPQNTWYVAMDAGVFRTTDAGNTWTNIGTPLGLPPVVITDIVAVPGTRFINVGTYGRGFWRLYLPQNNANLATFTISPTTIVGGYGSASGTVTLTNAAPNGGTQILLSGDSTVSYPSSVTVPQGSTSASFNIKTSTTKTEFYASLTATQASIALTQSLDVKPLGVSSVVISPNLVIGGKVIPSAVYLDANAPTGGVKVTLSSSKTDVTVPKTVTIPAGSDVAYFNVTTVPVSSNETATIYASGAYLSANATVTVESPSLLGLTVSPTLVVGGSTQTVTGTLNFSGPAPAAGVEVTLASLYPNAATVPAKVTAKPTSNNLNVSFKVTTFAVQTGIPDVIYAKDQYQNYYQANLGIIPFFITNLSTSPTSVVGGQNATGTVQINQAPDVKTGGITIALKANSTDISMPASVTIPVAATSATFIIKTKPLTSTTQEGFSATYAGAKTTATLTVTSPVLASFTLSPTTIIGGKGHNVTGTVTLNEIAPLGGITVSLGTFQSDIVSPPATVVVPKGQKTATFTMPTAKVLNATKATVYATTGSTTLSAAVTVKG